jgi:hypothetical protein
VPPDGLVTMSPEDAKPLIGMGGLQIIWSLRLFFLISCQCPLLADENGKVLL